MEFGFELQTEGASTFKEWEQARGAHHRQGADLCRCHRAAQGRGEMPGADEAPASEVPQQCARSRPRQAQAAYPAGARVQGAKDGLPTLKGFEVMRALRKGQAGPFALERGIVGEAKLVESAFGLAPCAPGSASQCSATTTPTCSRFSLPASASARISCPSIGASHSPSSSSSATTRRRGCSPTGRSLRRPPRRSPRRCGIERHVNLNNGAASDYETGLARAEDGFEAAALDITDTWMIMYTSGTTGRPKGARITHLTVFVSKCTSRARLETPGVHEAVECGPGVGHEGWPAGIK